MRYLPIILTRSITKRALPFLAAALAFAFPRLLPAQQTTGQEPSIVTVHGRVLNQVTKAPVARALVTTAGNEFAAMTNDQGEFELAITSRSAPFHSNMDGGKGSVWVNVGPQKTARSLTVRKPGFLQPSQGTVRLSGKLSDVIIYLVPEALIVGHVEIPGEQGEIRIPCELYRRETAEGHEEWRQADRFTTWLDGEFRFSNLRAGTYKLITNEQMDRNSQFPVPGAKLFGYPPVYYPNTTDFSLATPITVRAGETAEVNLAVARRAYYPVRIAVGNPPSGRPMNVTVYPAGHRSPGWSLGYNPMEQTIEGMLPDGTYTLEADAIQESFGMTNFTVRGRPSIGASVQLVPNTSITINIHEQFQSTESNAAIGVYGTNDEQSVIHAQVTLTSVEEMQGLGGMWGQPVPGSQGRVLTLRNVRPGTYRISVIGGAGYVASIESGGVDLLKQPLVVGLGGGNPPIDVTLRDDGGQVSGTVHEADSSEGNGANTPPRYVYLLPVEGSSSPLRQSATWSGNSFYIDQVAPGNYLVIVFDQRQDGLPYGSEEAIRPLLKEGKMVHVEAGQKVSVDLQVADGSNLE
jgi:hypothetical protein